MPKDSNFFEEAMKLCSESDPNVSHIAGSLYQCMLEEKQQKNGFPIGDFNILYFFQAVITVWYSLQSEIKPEKMNHAYSCESIRGCNWPPLESVGNRMIDDFIELVRTESVPEGSDFDVTYATKIIGLLIDNNGEFRKSSGQAIQNEDEFDYWLSGFNDDRS